MIALTTDKYLITFYGPRGGVKGQGTTQRKPCRPFLRNMAKYEFSGVRRIQVIQEYVVR